MNPLAIFGLQMIVSICTVFIVEKLIDVWKGRRNLKAIRERIRKYPRALGYGYLGETLIEIDRLTELRVTPLGNLSGLYKTESFQWSKTRDGVFNLTVTYVQLPERKEDREKEEEIQKDHPNLRPYETKHPLGRWMIGEQAIDMDAIDPGGWEIPKEKAEELAEKVRKDFERKLLKGLENSVGDNPPPLGIDEADNLHIYWTENSFKGIDFGNLRHRSISYPVQFHHLFPSCRYSTEPEKKDE